MKAVKLTEQEWELIDSIRNLKYSNNHLTWDMEFFVRELFENLLDSQPDSLEVRAELRK
ncbi:hypothetical protein AGMMS49965_21500 [Bacteroidia bacterium]|nr:hypothetical protein AGMMS4957_04810 [Bacteroidia bacterium]GHT44971.1 hypothetical protein AGMMS49965_21500 [Bacteroidia bacterium]